VTASPPSPGRAAVLDLIRAALADPTQEPAAADALVGIALYDDDQVFAERCCIEVGSQAASGSQMLGLAGLCLGHVARRFRHVSDDARALAESLAARATADPSDVDTRAIDGLDDLHQFTQPDITSR